MIASDGCDCPACLALAAEYATDPVLLRFHRSRLLVRGWAGKKSDTERAYILAHAPFAQAGAATLRRLPGFAPKPHAQTARGGGAVQRDPPAETAAPRVDFGEDAPDG